MIIVVGDLIGVVGSSTPGMARKLTPTASNTVDYYCEQFSTMMNERFTYKYREATPLAI